MGGHEAVLHLNIFTIRWPGGISRQIGKGARRSSKGLWFARGGSWLSLDMMAAAGGAKGQCSTVVRCRSDRVVVLICRRRLTVVRQYIRWCVFPDEHRRRDARRPVAARASIR